ncbi:hypothetical protein Ddye_015535 [Dipteronia dyeriana]|uniref:RIN4 pathogenic type III effector avirulence factor Avr cleavage site domain-containing protein n=1 Tax=Dipteronia dyeriana TaxID=168575 RepID=A0AAD9WYK9_9ROSI|nr:hypothetical protein Ddye_015535 [Dipteronia dyeriana]
MLHSTVACLVHDICSQGKNMLQEGTEQGGPLPKFGEWDVNNPASAEGFTVIFNKARDDKKTKSTNVKILTPKRNDNAYKKNDHSQFPGKRKWLCCG